MDDLCVRDDLCVPGQMVTGLTNLAFELLDRQRVEMRTVPQPAGSGPRRASVVSGDGGHVDACGVETWSSRDRRCCRGRLGSGVRGLRGGELIEEFGPGTSDDLVFERGDVGGPGVEAGLSGDGDRPSGCDGGGQQAGEGPVSAVERADGASEATVEDERPAHRAERPERGLGGVSVRPDRCADAHDAVDPVGVGGGPAQGEGAAHGVGADAYGAVSEFVVDQRVEGIEVCVGGEVGSVFVERASEAEQVGTTTR